MPSYLSLHSFAVRKVKNIKHQNISFSKLELSWELFALLIKSFVLQRRKILILITDLFFSGSSSYA